MTLSICHGPLVPDKAVWFLKSLITILHILTQGEVAQTIYAHVSKCKNDKIKEKRKKYILYINSL
jgi:hypothetical protein